MNYYELTFQHQSSLDPETIHDVLASELGDIGFESFTSIDGSLQGYISEKAYDKDVLKHTLAHFPLEEVQFTYTEQYIEGEDWNAEWEKNYFKPITIGNDCVIHASFHQVEPVYTYNIVIDPKMAFGTGNHETTYLMIEEMLKQNLKDTDVLDMGCGTAVLAILAAMKGARNIVAIDIDEWAFDNAKENIRLNHTDIEVRLGGAEQIQPSDTFDFIFANINRNILTQDLWKYAAALSVGGSLFMSGFYEEDIPVITEECERQGLTMQSFAERNKWVAVKTQHLST